MDKRFKLLVVGLLVLMAVVGVVSAWDSFEYVAGDNPTCADLNCAGDSLKIDYPSEDDTGTYHVDGITIVISEVNDIIYISWSSPTKITCVIVKAAHGANVYRYNGDGSTGDFGLVSPPPNDTNTDTSASISHLTFCGNIPAPEFPTLALPVGMMLGFAGVVYVVRKREN
jgi:hypothetical protein